jgi:hypothetical protein
VLGRISDLGGSFFLLLLGTGAYLLGLFMNVLFVALQFVPVDDLFPPETK